MARSLESKPNVTPPGGDYPYGRIKDNPGNGTGTPVNEIVYGDYHQYFSRLMDEAGLEPNDLPENSANGFQFNAALATVILKRMGSNNGVFDLNNLRHPMIINVTNAYANIPAGFTQGQLLVAAVLPDDNECRQRVVDHSNGWQWSRIFDGTVWSAWVFLGPGAWTNIPLINGWIAFGAQTPQYRIDNFGRVYLRGQLQASGSSNAIFTTALPNIIASGAGSNDYAIVLGSGGDYARISIDSVSGAGRGQVFAADYDIGKRYKLEQIIYWNS